MDSPTTTVLIVCIETTDLTSAYSILEEAVDRNVLSFYTLTKNGMPQRLPLHRPDLAQLADDVFLSQGFTNHNM